MDCFAKRNVRCGRLPLTPRLFLALARRLKIPHPNVPLPQSNPDIFHESLYGQMEQLIVRPLESRDLSTVIVIDALDEYKYEEPTSAILSVLGRLVERIPSVKFFVTGRPEPRIQTGFHLPLLRNLTDVFVILRTFRTRRNSLVLLQSSRPIPRTIRVRTGPKARLQNLLIRHRQSQVVRPSPRLSCNPWTHPCRLWVHSYDLRTTFTPPSGSARKMLQSTSAPPISSEGTFSSDEEDEILNTHAYVITTLGKGFESGINAADVHTIAGHKALLLSPPL